MSAVEVRVPDIGDAKGVAVLEVLVKKGDKVALEDPLITLESDKAAMDVPSPVGGVINSIADQKGRFSLVGHADRDRGVRCGCSARTRAVCSARARARGGRHRRVCAWARRLPRHR